MDGKKYYWLKLPKDFFKRHDITYLLSLPEGSKMVIFYLRLMTESVDHDGELRFSEELPYNVEILSSITFTSEELVNRTLNILTDLGLVQVDEDETIILPKVKELIGSASDTEGARRVRKYREKQQSLQNVTPPLQNVTDTVTKDNESKSKRKSKSIDKEKSVKEKISFGEFSHVLLTSDEYSKLSERFGEQKTTEYIVKLDRYIENYPAKGNKYKSHYATILNWIDKDGKEAPKGIEPTKRINPYDVDDILNQAAAIEEREKGGNR